MKRTILIYLSFLLLLSCGKGEGYDAGLKLMDAYFRCKEDYDKAIPLKSRLKTNKDKYDSSMDEIHYVKEVAKNVYLNDKKNYDELTQSLRTRLKREMNKIFDESDKKIIIGLAGQKFEIFKNKTKEELSAALINQYSLLYFEEDTVRIEKISGLEDFADWTDGPVIESMIEELTGLTGDKIDELYDKKKNK